MKKATMVRVLLCVVIFGVLIASAFVDTTQKPTGNAVAVGSYANGNPAADEAAAADAAAEVAQKRTFADVVADANNFLNDIAWGIFMCVLLVGTGALAGIISNSSLKDVIISGIETLGLPAFMLAPIAGMMMGAATASATAGTTLASQIFGPTVVASGIAPLAAAAMTNASVFVFDGLPHGSFFHVSAGGVNMGINERLKLLGYEAINGFAMLAVSTLVFGVFRVLG